MSRPLICSGQWSQTATGITKPAARRIYARVAFHLGPFDQYVFNFT